MVEDPRHRIEQNQAVRLLSLIPPPVSIYVIRGTRVSLSGLERVVHQYRENNDQAFDQYLLLVLGPQ